MCVRARRCQCSSTESARSSPQRLYKHTRPVCAQRCFCSCSLFLFDSVSTARFFRLDLGFFRRRLGFWVFLSVTWVSCYLLSTVQIKSRFPLSQDSVLAQMQLLEPAKVVSDNKPSNIPLALYGFQQLFLTIILIVFVISGKNYRHTTVIWNIWQI